MKQTTKKLILNMMLASGSDPIAIQDIIGACQLFGVRSDNVRVTVQRLVAENLLVLQGRGFYALGPGANRVAAELSQWRNSLQLLTFWQGDWVGIHCAGLGRTDRSSLKERERALELCGFRELSKDLYVRPNNLKGGINKLRKRALEFGLDPEAPVFQISDFNDSFNQKLNGLWKTQQLENGYRKTTLKMHSWLAKVDNLSPLKAAKESFLLGSDAIRQLVYDPLLPEQMINAAEREVFFRTLLQFDSMGHTIWRALLEQANSQGNNNISTMNT